MYAYPAGEAVTGDKGKPHYQKGIDWQGMVVVVGGGGGRPPVDFFHALLQIANERFTALTSILVRWDAIAN